MSSNAIASQIPWWGRIAAKVLLARLPVRYSLWKRWRLFERGAMDQPAYAYAAFRKHFQSAQSRINLEKFVGMELGPGDSLLSAMAAHAHGASAYYLVDVGPFAQADVQQYRAMGAFLANQGLRTPDTAHFKSVETILAACRATYGTGGLTSLRAIPDNSVDLVWSHSVLQHISRAEFLQTMRELRRVLREDGISSHWVDLQDMLGGDLNNLRFRESVWESPFMAGSGFYTNRIRYSEMLTLFKKAGLEAEVVSQTHWEKLPTPRSKLWDRFREIPEEELCVRCFHVILRPGSKAP